MAAASPKRAIPPRKREEERSSRLAGVGAKMIAAPDSSAAVALAASPGGAADVFKSSFTSGFDPASKTPLSTPRATGLDILDSAQEVLQRQANSVDATPRKLGLAGEKPAYEMSPSEGAASDSLRMKRNLPASDRGAGNSDFSAVAPVGGGGQTSNNKAGAAQEDEVLLKHLNDLSSANADLQRQLDEKSREAEEAKLRAEEKEREAQLEALLQEANDQVAQEKEVLEQRLNHVNGAVKNVEDERDEAKERIRDLEQKLAEASKQRQAEAEREAREMKDNRVSTPPAASSTVEKLISSNGKEEANRFLGAWEEKTGDQKCINIVTETLLKWSNNSTNHVKFVGTNMHMEFKGENMTAWVRSDSDKWSLDELVWSDGDVWKRAGIDGSWKDIVSGIIHTIGNSTITTHMGNGKKATKTLTTLSVTSFSILHEGVTCVARLDEKASTLTWSDGDTWEREAKGIETSS